MTKLSDKYNILLEKEQRFAKRVVYLMRAYTQRPWWHMFIPFRFLFEYFALKKDIRNFTSKHVHLKQIALSAAFRGVESQDPAKSSREMQAELRDFWLHVEKLESQELYEQLSDWMELLFKHYYRLFQASADNYITLIRQAYTSKNAYQGFLDQMAEIEKKIDQALLEALGVSQPDQYIQDKQKAMQQEREIELGEIFHGTQSSRY